MSHRYFGLGDRANRLYNLPVMSSITPMESIAREIAGRLRAASHVAYFAGGCVRDLLRGQVPKDFDIATDAKPEAVQKIFSRTYAVGAHFGARRPEMNLIRGGTFRSDGAYLDGGARSKSICRSGRRRARRDFTINRMFFDPAKDEVIDFVDGKHVERLVRATRSSPPFRGRLRMCTPSGSPRFSFGSSATWEAVERTRVDY